MTTDISLSASTRNNLAALQNTANLLQTTQAQLASGKKVNNASDNATSYFASQGFLNRANDLSALKDSLSTALQTATSVNQSITSVQSLVTQLQGVVTSAQGSTDTTVRTGLATQFNALAAQLDTLVNDATFNGTNLINSAATTNTMVVQFNESNTTSLTIAGVNLSSTTLNINAAGFGGAISVAAGDTALGTMAANLLTAVSTLRTDAASFGGNATLIQTRQDFTTNLISSLQTASDNLILANTNQAGANLQALQAQNSLGMVALNISGQQSQAILRLFP